MIETDIIISINVHEKINFLIKQIKNINEYVLLNYIIIINANKYMYDEISKCEFIKSQDNIILNENYLEKKLYHGSLTEGIYLNMKYIFNNYKFKYFIILSSRNLFYNKLNNTNYNLLEKKNHGIPYEKLDTKVWHWPRMIKTKLSRYIIKNNLLFACSAHEGLTFDYINCKDIIQFLDNNDDIKTDLFNYNTPVEEFALQTICINLNGYYYYIGNGTTTQNNINNLPKSHFVYKTRRI
jgi:hypothetical protein